MLTIFSTPKPFVGHIDVIQRNAIGSWQRLHPDVDVILAGDDAGTAEICAELGLRHLPNVKKNRHGTKYLASIYDQAQQAARHAIVCHANCDIVLVQDFATAVTRITQTHANFLMAGRRWDVNVRQPLRFDTTLPSATGNSAKWETDLRHLAQSTGHQRPSRWIDYFVFRKGLYANKIPEFVIGRPGWDNWLLWYAKSTGVPVVDASKVVMAVHQNHDYAYHPQGEQGVWQGEEAQENYRLNRGQFATLDDAEFVMDARGLRRNYRGPWIRRSRATVAAAYRVWFAALDATRPLRYRLGLRITGSARRT